MEAFKDFFEYNWINWLYWFISGVVFTGGGWCILKILKYVDDKVDL